MVTEGHLARHHGGRRGQRDPAFIDIAQDHALKILDEAGVFELGAALKGGTAIRKFRAGNAGRFSTDFDFTTSDPDVAKFILTTLDGAELGGFRFGVQVIREGRQASLLIENANLGNPPGPAKIDISTRAPWLAPERVAPVELAIHGAYGFAIPSVPTMRVEEVLAEKLARYRRHALARDLYDLNWFSDKVFNEALVRRLLVLKVWQDVVEDRLGQSPFSPAEVTARRRAEDFNGDEIVGLTQEVDIPGWLERVRRRFAFVDQLDNDERQIARCSAGDRYAAGQMIRALGLP
ncbi:MAG TPA: nucleotidyl transferase AbiEii/AbiGii toxin family protein [Gemmatimonadaceae bacterium]